MVVSEARIAAVRATMTELPEARRRRFVAAYGLPEYDAGVLTQSAALASYFEQVASAAGNPKAASNWVMGELLRTMNERGTPIEAVPLHAGRPGRTRSALVDQGTISSSIAKDVFTRMYDSGRAADEIVAADGLAQIGDESALMAIVQDVLGRNADAVAQYRAGKSGDVWLSRRPGHEGERRKRESEAGQSAGQARTRP